MPASLGGQRYRPVCYRTLLTVAMWSLNSVLMHYQHVNKHPSEHNSSVGIISYDKFVRCFGA